MGDWVSSLVDELRNRGKKLVSLDTPKDQDWYDVGTDVVAGFTPVLGTATALRDYERARRDDDYLGMGLSALGTIPVVGGVTKGINKIRTINALKNAPLKTEFEIAHELAQRNATLPYKEGGLNLPPDNTAMERARAMGFETTPGKRVYHSARGDWETNLVNPGISDLGFHVGTLEQAENRAKAFGPQGVNYGEGANIIPLVVSKYSNMLPVKDAGSFHADAIARQLEQKKLLAKGKAKQIEQDIAADWKKTDQYDDQMRDVLRQHGFDGVKYKNQQEGNGLSLAITNPSVVRSRFAAFDPLKRDSSDILAGVAGTAITVPALIEALRSEQQ